MEKKRIWNQCGKKNRYRDEHAANYYRRIFEEERGIKLDYYWCPYCNGYHLTSEEFRPEGYGLREDENGNLIYVGKSDSQTANIRSYYIGKKYRIRMSAAELERMYAV